MRNLLSTITLFYFLLFFQSGFAQTDSIVLRMDSFKAEDIINKNVAQDRQKVISASRSLKDVDELPFTIYVVTQDEIIKNGYVTLVDVLKSIPGIRVSQPGSALEGETFLMRGLLGNSYAKILINDLPIKPSGVSGMPIGAQLPVRQAERIEIIFGPTAAVYGADAAAGVINIITKDTDKPLFTRADLGLGTNAYTDLNVMFGGKIGMDKRILHFTFYGSNTSYDDRKTIYDQDSLYDPYLYASAFNDSSYVRKPTNYRGTTHQPIINTLPHLSRMIGIELKYKSLRFAFNHMYRRDHSAVGLNPVAVSYANPTNFIGEDISRYVFGIQKDRKYFGFSTYFTVVDYKLDERSSQTYVQNSLYRFFQRGVLSQPPDPMIRDSIREVIFDKYFSGIRYSTARSIDAYIEQIFNIHPIKNFEFVIGFNAKANSTLPISRYNGIPVNPENYADALVDFEDQFPIESVEVAPYGLGAFSQLFLTLKNLNFIAGLRYDYDDLFGGSFNPRIALNYQINPTVSIRGTYAKAFRAPSKFYDANTYFLQGNAKNFNLSTRQQLDIPDLNAEQTYSYEFGGRLKAGDFFSADVALFYTQTKDLISYTFDPDLVLFSGEFGAAVGYFNGQNTAVTLYGLQSQLRFRNIWKKYLLNVTFNSMLSKGNEVLPFNNGELDQVRMQPKFFGQVNVSFSPRRKIHLNFTNNFSSSWLRRQVVSEDLVGEGGITPGYYTLDVLLRLQLSRNFLVSLGIKNFFSQQYGGIGATGFIDDLYYNPQPLSTYIFSLSYNLD